MPSHDRDRRHPVLYTVPAHPLDPSPDVDKTIYVFILDTSPGALEEAETFENSLKIPLGRTAAMKSKGKSSSLFLTRATHEYDRTRFDLRLRTSGGVRSPAGE